MLIWRRSLDSSANLKKGVYSDAFFCAPLVRCNFLKALCISQPEERSYSMCEFQP